MENLRSLTDSILNYRKERTIAHETGHTAPKIVEYYPEGEGTEIELFNPEIMAQEAPQKLRLDNE